MEKKKKKTLVMSNTIDKFPEESEKLLFNSFFFCINCSKID